MRKLGIASFTLLLVAIIAPSAAALTVTTNIATSDPSGITYTYTATNETLSPVTTQITVSDIFSAPLGEIVAQFVAEGFLTGPPGTLVAGSFVLSGYLDPANSPLSPVPSTAVLLGTADASTVPVVGLLVPFTASSAYGLILLADVTLGPLESVSFSHRVSISSATASVPEPATAMRLTVGLVAAADVSRRQCRRVTSSFQSTSAGGGRGSGGP